MMKLNYKMGLAESMEGASLLVNNIKDTKGERSDPKGGVEREHFIDLSTKPMQTPRNQLDIK